MRIRRQRTALANHFHAEQVELILGQPTFEERACVDAGAGMALMQDQALPEATHEDMANAIRTLAMDAVEKADSGHPGMPMGMADVATVLFTRFLKFDAAHPDWPDRDRFVLSAGHGSMLLYALLYLTGYPEMELDELKRFRQLGSRTPGHPEYGHAPGIETTTGPLGQGLGNAVGMALAERLLNRRYGDEIVSHYTYCVAGDGCLMEGLSQEAISHRPPQARPPHRAVRRQSYLHRRPDQPVGL